MHLKRFRGPTVADALQAARAELGPQALVLGTRLVSAGGWRGLTGAREVEISAALERQVSDERHPRQAERPAVPASQVAAARMAAAGFAEPVVAAVLARLRGRRAGVPSPKALRHALTEWSSEIAAPDDRQQQIEVFIGPAGAGKTTTVAKIAARARVERNARLRLVSADAFRVGAIEQLRLYAEIIGSPFDAARTTPELATLLANEKAPVLVDTAGRSPRDARAHELMTLVASLPDARVHLVVPASTSPRALERVIAAHAAARPQRLVLTKTDECDTIAPLAGVIREHGLRVSYLGTGQRVPDDLQRATPGALSVVLSGDASHETGHAA
jgi:flagellar biosynthesis protein FlhF